MGYIQFVKRCMHTHVVVCAIVCFINHHFPKNINKINATTMFANNARVYAMTQSLIHALYSTCRRAECCQVPESKGNPAKKPMYPRT